jgi:hypothetical protein
MTHRKERSASDFIMVVLFCLAIIVPFSFLANPAQDDTCIAANEWSCAHALLHERSPSEWLLATSLSLYHEWLLMHPLYSLLRALYRPWPWRLEPCRSEFRLSLSLSLSLSLRNGFVLFGTCEKTTRHAHHARHTPSCESNRRKAVPSRTSIIEFCVNHLADLNSPALFHA